MEIQSKRSWLQTGKRLISKIAIGAIMIIFWSLLLVWPLYNWLTG